MPVSSPSSRFEDAIFSSSMPARRARISSTMRSLYIAAACSGASGLAAGGGVTALPAAWGTGYAGWPTGSPSTTAGGAEAEPPPMEGFTTSSGGPEEGVNWRRRRISPAWDPSAVRSSQEASARPLDRALSRCATAEPKTVSRESRWVPQTMTWILPTSAGFWKRRRAPNSTCFFPASVRVRAFSFPHCTSAYTPRLFPRPRAPATTTFSSPAPPIAPPRPLPASVPPPPRPLLCCYGPQGRDIGRALIQPDRWST